MLLKMASQGGDVIHFLEHWGDQSSRSFEGDKSELIRLAYENPSLRPLILKEAGFARKVRREKMKFKQLGKKKKNKKQKGKSLRDKKKRDSKENKGQKITEALKNYDNATDAKSQNAAISALKAQVPPDKKDMIFKLRKQWESYKDSKTFTNEETKNEVKFESLPSEQQKEITKDKYLKKIKQLGKSDTKKKDDSKKEDKGKSDGGKGKSDGGKGKSDKPKEKAVVKEDTSKAPDSSESATGQSVSTSGGLGGLGDLGGSSSGDGGSSSGGGEGYQKVE